jgi:hypothetical protein
MTPRLFMIAIRVGALSIVVAAGAVMVFCALSGGILYVASLGHKGAQLAADIAIALALASLFSWASGAILLATAAWLIAEAIGRAFARRVAGES